MPALHCFEVLLDEEFPAELPGVVAAYGDDGFLRQEVVEAILRFSGIERDEAKSLDGDECEWVDVHDELATLSLFDTSSRRVAIVRNADRLIKDARPQLEKWCQTPTESSLLVMQVASLPANTKLYKSISKRGWAIQCSLPTGSGRSKTIDEKQVQRWIEVWAKSRHGLTLGKGHAKMIMDAVGLDCGLLHQELAKLALYVDEDGKLTDKIIREHVGSWRTRTMWDIADLIAEGRATDALKQLERVFAAGEVPQAVVPQVSWSLRRYGKAAHLILQAKRAGKPMTPHSAISQSGFYGKSISQAEERLRSLGLRRAMLLLNWLLELDLKIKGSHSSPNRAIFAVEELCLRLATPATGSPASSAGQNRSG